MGALGNGLFDTNILIDFLSGYEPAREEIQRHARRGISLITWMEVMVGAHPSQEMGTREVLDDFELLPVSIVVAEKAVILRKERRLKLPDAVILATAMSAGWVLVSRNTKDFLDEPGVIRNPYTL